MKIRELTVILDHVRQLYLSAGAKAPAKDIKTLSDALGPHADKSVEVFVATIESKLSLAKAKPKSRTRAASKPLNEGAISYHISQLRQVGSDRPAFDRALGEVKSD